jgi:hypothetical protein
MDARWMQRHMIDGQNRDALVIMGGLSVGGLVASCSCGEAFRALTLWWGPATWIDIAWLISAFLFCVLAGMVAGVEAVAWLAGIVLPGKRGPRIAFRPSASAMVAGWFGASKMLLWRLTPWGFWVSIAVLLVLSEGIRRAADRLGVLRVTQA